MGRKRKRKRKPKSVSDVFASPATVATFAKAARLSCPTARNRVLKLCRDGKLFKVGSIRTTGRDAAVYCVDPMVTPKREWHVGERERLVGPVIKRRKVQIDLVEAKAHAKRILRSGQTVVLGPEMRFMRDLVEHHPDADQVIGVGIASIWVARNSLKQPTFFLLRKDGTYTHFNYMLCVTPVPPLERFKKVCREVIGPQVDAFKTKAFEGRTHVPCPMTGRLITISQACVQHVPSFDELLGEFCKRSGVQHAVHVESDARLAERLADPELPVRWAVFHRQEANLRVVSGDA